MGDPQVVPPATEEENPAQEEGDQSCSSRGSRSCSSNSRRRRPKLFLPRFQKLFLQLPETSQRSHPHREELCSQESLDERRSIDQIQKRIKIQDEGSRSGTTQDSCPEPQADRVTITNYIKIVADVRPEAKRRFYKNWSQSKKKAF